MSQSIMSSRAMKVRIAPKRNLGTYDMIEIGIMKTHSMKKETIKPVRRVDPARIQKIVCEKMYDPVYPPSIPLTKFDTPTYQTKTLFRPFIPLN